MIGWCVAISLCSLVVFGFHHRDNCNPADTDCPLNTPKSMDYTYQATHRDAFALGVAWIVFACCSGYGGKLHQVQK